MSFVRGSGNLEHLVEGRNVHWEPQTYIVLKTYQHQGCASCIFEIERRDPQAYLEEIGRYTPEPVRLGQGQQHSSFDLRLKSQADALLGQIMDWLAYGNMAGRAEGDAAWALFWELEVRPKKRWLKEAAPDWWQRIQPR